MQGQTQKPTNDFLLNLLMWRKKKNPWYNHKVLLKGFKSLVAI